MPATRSGRLSAAMVSGFEPPHSRSDTFFLCRIGILPLHLSGPGWIFPAAKRFARARNLPKALKMQRNWADG